MTLYKYRFTLTHETKMLSNLKCFEIYILTNILHQQPKIKLIIYYNVPDVRKMKEVAANIDFSDINGSASLASGSGLWSCLHHHPTTCILKIVKIIISDNFPYTRDNVSLSTFWWCPEPPLVSRRQWYSPVYRAQLSKYTFVKSVFYRKIFLQNLFLLAGLRTS